MGALGKRAERRGGAGGQDGPARSPQDARQAGHGRVRLQARRDGLGGPVGGVTAQQQHEVEQRQESSRRAAASSSAAAPPTKARQGARCFFYETVDSMYDSLFLFI